MKKKLYFLYALVMAIFFCPQLSNGSAEQVSEQITEMMKGHGYGFITRVINNSDEPADIRIVDKKIHDALPSDTQIRIKSLDPKLGPDGAYFVLQQDKNNPFWHFETTKSREKATVFTVYRYIAPNLDDWIGLSTPKAKGNMINFNEKTKKVDFDGETKNFKLAESTAMQWKIAGTDINNCMLQHNLTGGVLKPVTAEENINEGKGQTIIHREKDVWGIYSAETRPKNKMERLLADLMQERLKYDDHFSLRSLKTNLFVTTLTPNRWQGTHWDLTPRLAKLDRSGLFKLHNDNPQTFDSMRGKQANYMDGICFVYDYNPSNVIVYGSHDGGARYYIWPMKYFPEVTPNNPWLTHRFYPEDGQDSEEPMFFGDTVTVKTTGAGTYWFDPGSGQRLTFSHEHGDDVKFKLLDKDGKGKGPELIKLIMELLDTKQLLHKLLKKKMSENIDDDIKEKLSMKRKLLIKFAMDHVRDFDTDELPSGLIYVKKDEESNWKAMGARKNLFSMISIHGLRTGDPKKMNVWGVKDKNLYHLLDEEKDEWKEIQVNETIEWLSSGADQSLWYIADGELHRRKKDGNFEPFIDPTTQVVDEEKIGWKKVSIQSDNEVWGIKTDGHIYNLKNMALPEKKPFPHGEKALDVSISEDKSVWAVNTKNQVYRYVEKDDKWEQITGPKVNQITARSKDEAWGLDVEGHAHKYVRGQWSQESKAKFSFLAIASGISEEFIPDKPVMKVVKSIGVQDKDGKPYDPSPDAKVQLEIAKLGMGGAIAPGRATERLDRVPFAKNPVISGFATTKFEDVSESSLIELKGLQAEQKDSGAAWIERALSEQNRGTISFLARAGDDGGISIVFGQDISTNFTWKIVIGGWQNTTSQIIRRHFEGNEPRDETLYEVTQEQNPLAQAVPGQFVPYWASVDNGLIMVGVGLPGENIIMAVRDETPAYNIKFAGIGCHKRPVEFTELQTHNPVVVQEPIRLFKEITDSFDAPAGNINILEHPFRTKGRGSIGFEVQGKEKVALFLGEAKDNTKEHYLIVFGDTNAKGKQGISIRKYVPLIEDYVLRAFVNQETHPSIALSGSGTNSFWVSYQSAQLVLGQGEIGDNTFFVYNDLNPYDEIHTIGFGSLGQAGATINNLTIAPPTEIEVEVPETVYKTLMRGSTFFRGGVSIKTPFEYRGAQEKESLKFTDLIADHDYFPSSTPVPGQYYDFIFEIKPDGSPHLALAKTPENPLFESIQKSIIRKRAEAERAQQEGAITAARGASTREIAELEAHKIAQEGEVALKKAMAKGDIQRQMGQAMQAVSSGGTMGAGMMAGMTLPSLLLSAASYSAAMAIGAGSIGLMKNAAQKDLEGVQAQGQKTIESARMLQEAAKIEAKAKEKQLALENKAKELQYEANLLEGNLGFAMNKADQYAYASDVPRPQPGTISVPDRAKMNEQYALSKLEEVGELSFQSKDNLERIITLLQGVVNLTSHATVMDKEYTRRTLYDFMENLYSSYRNLYGMPSQRQDLTMYNRMLNLFITAYNNEYIANINNPQEAQIKGTWYSYINQLGRAFLTALKFAGLRIPPCYGEYIWLPIELEEDGQGSITFEVRATNDVFIGFGQEAFRTRNTNKEIYELVIGGWKNSRTVIRIDSLGKSVKEFHREQNPDAMLKPMEYEKYTVSLNNGVITLFKENKKVLEWEDPYPTERIRYIGLSSWDSPVEFRNIEVGKPTSKSTSKPAMKAKEPAKTEKKRQVRRRRKTQKSAATISA
ncbi:MAG: hypothetical protein H6679_06015 [Epsilonproteobacteria bacterium]|nr:hypothetical protein [Campylobacterota bacterium]